MDNFIYDIPTKLCFGGAKSPICPELVKAKRPARPLVYGGGSIVISLYDTILGLHVDCKSLELAGVEPNPRIESVRQGSPCKKTRH